MVLYLIVLELTVFVSKGLEKIFYDKSSVVIGIKCRVEGTTYVYTVQCLRQVYSERGWGEGVQNATGNNRCLCVTRLH